MNQRRGQAAIGQNLSSACPSRISGLRYVYVLSEVKLSLYMHNVGDYSDVVPIEPLERPLEAFNAEWVKSYHGRKHVYRARWSSNHGDQCRCDVLIIFEETREE